MLQIIPDTEDFAKIVNMTEEYVRLSEPERKMYINAIKEDAEKNEERIFLGLHNSDEANKINNYLYIVYTIPMEDMDALSFVTIMDGKYILFSLISFNGGAPTEQQKASFYSVLSTVSYDNKLTIEQAAVKVAQERARLRRNLAIGGVGIALLVVAVVLFSLQRKRSKKDGEIYVPVDRVQDAPFRYYKEEIFVQQNEISSQENQFSRAEEMLGEKRVAAAVNGQERAVSAVQEEMKSQYTENDAQEDKENKSFE